jgi:hypothetical protein
MAHTAQDRIEIAELIAEGSFAEASRRLAAPGDEPRGPPPLLPPAARRIVAAVEELDRALMARTSVSSCSPCSPRSNS